MSWCIGTGVRSLLARWSRLRIRPLLQRQKALLPDMYQYTSMLLLSHVLTFRPTYRPFTEPICCAWESPARNPRNYEAAEPVVVTMLLSNGKNRPLERLGTMIFRYLNRDRACNLPQRTVYILPIRAPPLTDSKLNPHQKNPKFGNRRGRRS